MIRNISHKDCEKPDSETKIPINAGFYPENSVARGIRHKMCMNNESKAQAGSVFGDCHVVGFSIFHSWLEMHGNWKDLRWSSTVSSAGWFVGLFTQCFPLQVSAPLT